MMNTSDSRLRRADITRLAEKYGVKKDWAEMTLKRWLERA